MKIRNNFFYFFILIPSTVLLTHCQTIKNAEITTPEIGRDLFEGRNSATQSRVGPASRWHLE